MLVWVDAAYNITQELVDFAKEYEGDFMLPTHPDKRSLTAEFNKLHAYGFSTKDEIIDMARLMQSRGYDPKDYRSNYKLCDMEETYTRGY